MTDYLKTVLAVLFCVALICGMFPKHGMEQYVGLATGLLMVFVILSPFVSGNTMLIPDFESLQFEELEESTSVYMKETFEETLAGQIREMLLQTTGQSFDAEVHANCDEQGSVTGVTSVNIAPYQPEYATIVANYVGIATEEVRTME